MSKHIECDMACVCGENTEYLLRTMQKEEIFDKLRQNGCRITKQRKALIEVILESECSCCKEIYYLALKKIPDIGLATIYRMINVLEDVGAIRRENLYRVCTEKTVVAHQCVVELENDTSVELNQDSLQKIIECGMESCGYFHNKKSSKVTNVILKNCSA